MDGRDLDALNCSRLCVLSIECNCSILQLASRLNLGALFFRRTLANGALSGVRTCQIMEYASSTMLSLSYSSNLHAVVSDMLKGIVALCASSPGGQNDQSTLCRQPLLSPTCLSRSGHDPLVTCSTTSWWTFSAVRSNYHQLHYSTESTRQKPTSPHPHME